MWWLSTIVPAIIVLSFIWSAVKIITEYQSGVLFRLGRFAGLRRPGLNFIIPFVDRLVIIDLRTVARDVPPQDVVTGDNVSVKVNAVLYFRVIHADKAVIQVENYLYATSQLAQTTLRSILGQVTLDELLAERDKLNKQLQVILDRQTEPWGVKVSNVEIKYVDLPSDMQRAIARQAVAERERRAKIIAAEGEYQAAEKITEAAEIMTRSPVALPLRYLHTLVEISSERNTFTVFPIPMDLLGGLTDLLRNRTPPTRSDERTSELAREPVQH